MKKFLSFVTALTLLMALLHGVATESLAFPGAGDGERLRRGLVHLLQG